MLLREDVGDEGLARTELAQLFRRRLRAQKRHGTAVVPARARRRVAGEIEQYAQRVAAVFIHDSKCTMRADLGCLCRKVFSAVRAGARIPRGGNAARIADMTSCAKSRISRRGGSWKRKRASSNS